MSGRAEFLLGIIAVAAVIQAGALVAAGLLAWRLARLIEKIDRGVQPMFGHIDAIGREATRAAALATRQVERVDRLFADVVSRVEDTMNEVQRAVAEPARQASALMVGFRAALDTLRDLGSRRGRSRGRGDDEDTLFI
ncbi:MAG: hypothetical protein LBQ09_11960 [Acidobacteriaceae bacterium]|nr:hypothetical protein [Acidobacteriaceae bacterium]